MERRALYKWVLYFCATAIAVAICIRWIDYPVAKAFLSVPKHVGILGKIFGGHVIVAGELTVIFILAIKRLMTGNVPELARTFIVACSASVMA